MFGNFFGEIFGGCNENGVYFGMEIFLVKNWIISVYYDIWEYFWLCFNVDVFLCGYEYCLCFIYFKKCELDVFVEIWNEIKEVSVSLFDSNFDVFVDC